MCLHLETCISSVFVLFHSSPFLDCISQYIFSLTHVVAESHVSHQGVTCITLGRFVWRSRLLGSLADWVQFGSFLLYYYAKKFYQNSTMNGTNFSISLIIEQVLWPAFWQHNSPNQQNGTKRGLHCCPKCCPKLQIVNYCCSIGTC